MDYLITDDNHFGPMLKEISKFMPNHLQLRKNCDLNYF